MWIFLICLFPFAFSSSPNVPPVPLAVDRAPAIDGPATDYPVGENSRLYDFLEETERDTAAYDYHPNRKNADESMPIHLGEFIDSSD